MMESKIDRPYVLYPESDCQSAILVFDQRGNHLVIIKGNL